MPSGYEIVAIDADGNRTIDDYAYSNQVDAKGDVLELQRMNQHLRYLVVPRQIDAERLHSEPRYHPVGRYRNR